MIPRHRCRNVKRSFRTPGAPGIRTDRSGFRTNRDALPILRSGQACSSASVHADGCSGQSTTLIRIPHQSLRWGVKACLPDTPEVPKHFFLRWAQKHREVSAAESSSLRQVCGHDPKHVLADVSGFRFLVRAARRGGASRSGRRAGVLKRVRSAQEARPLARSISPSLHWREVQVGRGGPPSWSVRWPVFAPKAGHASPQKAPYPCTLAKRAGVLKRVLGQSSAAYMQVVGGGGQAWSTGDQACPGALLWSRTLL